MKIGEDNVYVYQVKHMIYFSESVKSYRIVQCIYANIYF